MSTAQDIAKLIIAESRGKTFSEEYPFLRWLGHRISRVDSEKMKRIWSEEKDSPRGKDILREWVEDGAPDDPVRTFGHMIIHDQVIGEL